jgi:hypothetical protein
MNFPFFDDNFIPPKYCHGKLNNKFCASKTELTEVTLDFKCLTETLYVTIDLCPQCLELTKYPVDNFSVGY